MNIAATLDSFSLIVPHSLMNVKKLSHLGKNTCNIAKSILI